MSETLEEAREAAFDAAEFCGRLDAETDFDEGYSFGVCLDLFDLSGISWAVIVEACEEHGADAAFADCFRPDLERAARAAYINRFRELIAERYE